MHENYNTFAKAYNNFDSHPLKGESLKQFYSDDLNRDTVKRIITSVSKAEPHKNILITGHIGSGKSTILNKIAELLKDKYHIAAFSASDELNLTDVETPDILVVIYLHLIKSVKDNLPENVLKSFEQIMKPARKHLNINTENPVKLLETVLLKIRTQTESRVIIRKIFRKNIEILQQYISKACNTISKQVKKEVLIIADDLDKLDNESAEKIFFGEPSALAMPEPRIIYAFPLAACYSPSYACIADKFASESVPLIHLRDIHGKYQKESLVKLMKLALKRIDKKLISGEALKCLAEKSGGLPGDLIKSMQDACKIAASNGAPVITEDISKKAVQYNISEYKRFFDFPKYEKQVIKIIKTRRRDEIAVENISYLLQYHFVLKYGAQENDKSDKSWYGAHPYLRKCFERGK
ncbi:MAG: AAA family ATPase [Desulfobacteraceae bacterium]|nr:AAA family ATPase [Desulfobacteraceae bacterium]